MRRYHVVVISEEGRDGAGPGHDVTVTTMRDARELLVAELDVTIDANGVPELHAARARAHASVAKIDEPVRCPRQVDGKGEVMFTHTIHKGVWPYGT